MRGSSTRLLVAFVATAVGVAAAAPLTPAVAAIDPALLAGMKARAIGPATTGGRISAVAAVPSAPNVLYVGAASGGVWYLRIAEEATAEALAALNRFYAEDVAAFRRQVGEAALRLLPELPALEVKP